MPKRIQLKRQKGWKMPPGAVYCARPGKWGNPLRESQFGSRRQCADAYRVMLNAALYGSMPGLVPLVIRQAAADIKELKGKDLACYCPLDGPCHADALMEAANK